MRKNFLAAFLLAILALTVASAANVQAQASLPPDCQEGSLPSNDPKFPGDQLILVCIPQNWNGNLVVYAHGFVPPQVPVALPIAELTLPDGTFVPQVLLLQGFAFATSSYHKNGVVAQQASRDLNDLVNHFKTLVPRRSLQKVFITGASEGGLVVMLLIERHPRRYDGGLALCAPVGGAPEQIQYAGDFRVVFDYFFPDVFPFGAADVPSNAFEDWESVYVPAIAAAITSNPEATGQLFNVTGAAVDPLDPTSAVETAVNILFYSIWGTNDLIATTGGMPYDNRFTTYTGSADDAALNAGVERINADRRAQNYARRFYETTGELQRPLVTLHKTLDPVVPFQHELNYIGLVNNAGTNQFLTVLPVEGYGHCNFTSEQIFGAFALMVQQATAQTER
ncbi:MAG TPA: alpha/beta hydrolase [Candidatus Binatia bacterium]|nr:alpha/beta hydrolase [Candidatus Binatia bacterium]